MIGSRSLEPLVAVLLITLTPSVRHRKSVLAPLKSPHSISSGLRVVMLFECASIVVAILLMTPFTSFCSLLLLLFCAATGGLYMLAM